MVQILPLFCFELRFLVVLNFGALDLLCFLFYWLVCEFRFLILVGGVADFLYGLFLLQPRIMIIGDCCNYIVLHLYGF